jgi:hypothetical protein
MFVEYFEAGFSVIPIITTTAAPFEKNWARWAKERQTPELIEEYERLYRLPRNGVGLVCGEASGIIALDIDSESHDILSLCPPSPVRKRGSKGETRFYRYTRGIHCINRKRKNIGPNKDKEEFEGIEVLSDGRQTVMPPSINRKTNKPYVWVTPDTLFDLKTCDLPELTQNDIAKVAAYIDTFGKAGTNTSAGRNDQLTRVVCAVLLQHPERDDEIIAQELLAYDARQHSVPYFTDMSEPEAREAGGDPFKAAESFVARHRLQISKKNMVANVRHGTEIWESLGLRCDKRGPIPNYDNMYKIVTGVPELSGAFWYDSFHGNIFTTWGGGSARPYCEVDAQRVQRHVQGALNVPTMQLTTVERALVEHARDNQRNEVLEWLNALPAWDGVGRIGTFFSAYVGSEHSLYSEAVSTNMFVALIARVMRPGCKAENMVILEGPQGILKSTALRSLIGDKWFGELESEIGTKDAILSLRGKWLIEVPELDALDKAGSETIKRALSVQVDRIRVPYGRTVEEFPRQSIFVGTTNAKAYLKDQTGGRRFWPLVCSEIRVDLIREHREQLFAEALAQYNAGATWWEVPKDAAMDAVNERTEQDPWENIILNHLADPVNAGAQITTTWLMTAALDIPHGQQHAGCQRRLVQILARNGYIMHRTNNARHYIKA